MLSRCLLPQRRRDQSKYPQMVVSNNDVVPGGVFDEVDAGSIDIVIGSFNVGVFTDTS